MFWTSLIYTHIAHSTHLSKTSPLHVCMYVCMYAIFIIHTYMMCMTPISILCIFNLLFGIRAGWIRLNCRELMKVMRFIFEGKSNEVLITMWNEICIYYSWPFFPTRECNCRHYYFFFILLYIRVDTTIQIRDH